MAAESPRQLTSGAIESYLDGHPPNVAYVQVINIKKIPNSNPSNCIDKYRLQLSDSTHYQPCLIVSSLSEKVSNGEIDRYCIIRVEEMIPTNIQGRKILLIKNLTVSQLGSTISHVIGSPSSLELRKADTNSSLSNQDNTLVQPVSIFNSNPSYNNMKEELVHPITGAFPITAEISANQSRISPITMLNPYNSYWTICARVTTKQPLRKWSNSKGEGQVLSFEFTDSSGIIRVTAFNELATDFDKRIVLDKIYLFSKADMRPTNKKFAGNSNHEFELYINTNSDLEECTSSAFNVPNITYKFRLIEEIKLLPKDTQVDFIGICVEVLDVVEIMIRSKGNQLSKRELILADKTKQKINCTLWGTDAINCKISGNPLILLKSAKVSDFNTCSLNIGTNSSLIINPDLSEARELQLWFESEGKFVELESVSAKGGFMEIQKLSPIIIVNSFSLDEKGEIFTFRATISLFKKDREIFYKSCPTEGCQKKVFRDEVSSLYRCEKCNLEFPNFKFRYMISMEILDHSGSIWVTSFKETESILGIAAEDLGEKFEHFGKSTIDAQCDNRLFTTYYFRTKFKEEKYNDESRLRGIILGVTTTENVIHDCRILLKKILFLSL